MSTTFDHINSYFIGKDLGSVVRSAVAPSQCVL